MPDHDDDHSLLVVMNFIDDAIVANSNTLCLTAGELAATFRPWDFGQCLQSHENPLLRAGRQSLELLFCRS
jgi:hypothetical protein